MKLAGFLEYFSDKHELVRKLHGFDQDLEVMLGTQDGASHEFYDVAVHGLQLTEATIGQFVMYSWPESYGLAPQPALVGVSTPHSGAQAVFAGVVVATEGRYDG